MFDINFIEPAHMLIRSKRITIFFLFNAALVETGLKFIKDNKEFTLMDDDDDSQKEYADKINEKKKEVFSYFKKFNFLYGSSP